MSAERWIVADLGGTNTRVGVYADGSMLPGVTRFPTPVGDRERHLDLVAEAVDRLRHEHSGAVGDTVGVAVGATVDAAGRVRNATMLWHAPHTGFDLLGAMAQRLPWARIALSNDIAAAAWRYRALGRFALVTISTGLAVKVFDDALPFESKLIQDPDGLGGEIGHVPVRTQAVLDPEIRGLARAAAAGDPAAGRALAARDIGWCECGNADDLCSHASGPAAARAVARLAPALPELWAASALHLASGGDPAAVTTGDIAAAAGEGDPFTAHVLLAVTRPLALYLLQCSAQLGLRRFVVMGGFAHGVGAPWFAALRANLRALLPEGAWFTGWTGEDVSALVMPSLDGDDSLVGMGALVQARQGWVRELHKPVGRRTTVVRRSGLPACGREQFLARVAFAGICTTDLQILRGDRGCEPGVLGHECVAEVVEAGADVGAVAPGSVLAVNPNHPFDDHDKLGHNLPGVLREVAVWDGALAERGQTIELPARGAAEWVLLEPLACAVRSLRQARDRWQGRTVVVVGVGSGRPAARAAGAALGRGTDLAGPSRHRAAGSRACPRPGRGRGLPGSGPGHRSGGARRDRRIRGARRGHGNLRHGRSADPGFAVGRRRRRRERASVRRLRSRCGGPHPGRLAAAQPAHPHREPAAQGRAAEGRELHAGGLARRRSAGLRARPGGVRARIRRHARPGPAGEPRRVAGCGAAGVRRTRRDRPGRRRGGPARRGGSARARRRGPPRGRGPALARRRLGGAAARSPIMTEPRTSPLDGLDAAELWTRLHDAATGRGGPAAWELAARCRVDGVSRLGWVCPPPWPLQLKALTPILAGLRVRGERAVLVLGTGGWSFAARALAELAGPATADSPVQCLDSLDPWTIRHTVAGGETPLRAYLAISGSGSTLETRVLTETVTALSPASVVRLCDRGAPPSSYSLSADDAPAHVAMLGAPLSTAFLAPAALADPQGLARAYTGLVGRHHELALTAAEQAIAMDTRGTPRVRIAAPAWAGEGLCTWLLQLGRQVLGGKSAAYRPRVEVVSAREQPDTDERGFALDLSAASADLAGLLALMYTAGVFAACLALRAGLRPVEHANVAAYKRLLAEVQEQRPPARLTPDQVPGFAADWLAARPDLRRLHLVRYGGAPAPLPAASSLAETTGRPCEVHTGSAWNHHSYQAVYAESDTAVLIWAGPVQEGALHTASHTLRRLAEATHASLADRGALIETTGG